MFLKEAKQWADVSMKLVKEKGTKESETYYHTTNIDYVAPMFEIMWGSTLVSLSVILESTDEQKLIDLCLDGFKYGIHISSIFLLDTQRAAFIAALEKFTNLNNIREMKVKNVCAVRTLIDIAKADGNYLHDSWVNVLRCISLLNHLHLVGAGMKADPHKKPQMGRTGSDILVGSANQTLETQNSRMMLIDEAAIDTIYSQSSKLSNKAIVHFVQCLCNVSLSEINSPNARTFSLQKLVDVAYYNMDRMRIVWSEVWLVLQLHFTQAGCHDNRQVSMIALDALRQLAFKFLEKDELANYSFQKEFLKPFEVIIQSVAPTEIKELIIQCLLRMVLTRSKNIRSGWKSIFVILTSAAEDEDKMVMQGFEVLNEIVKSHTEVISDHFFDSVTCVVAFASSHCLDANVSMRSVSLLNTFASDLCNGKITVQQLLHSYRQKETKSRDTLRRSSGSRSRSRSSSVDASLPADSAYRFTDSFTHMSCWTPILHGVATVISHPNVDVRGWYFYIKKTQKQLFLSLLL